MKLKKIVASILALASVSSFGAMTVSAAEESTYTYPNAPGTYLVGDVNEDGAVRVNDVQLIRSALLHLADPLDGNRLADANKDGSVRVNDVQLIRTVILHLAEQDVLGEFTIYTEDVLGGSDVLPALATITDITTIDKATIEEVSNGIISALEEYSNFTDEQKAEIDSSALAQELYDKFNVLYEALLNADETTTPALAETVANIISVYEELGVSKQTLLDQVIALLTDNGITIDANAQATALAIFAQAKAIYDANGGVITAEQLLNIINSLK